MLASQRPAAAEGPLSAEDLAAMHRYWRAANYLTVGQIYLQDNPLLREPLRPSHIKPRLLGHWGTSPGLNLVYAHLNRLIREHDVDAIYLAGRVMAAQPCWRMSTWREPTLRSTPRSRGMQPGCGALQAVLDARWGAEPRERATPQARSTRGASSATSSPTPSAQPSTTPTSSPVPWSATARRRPAAGGLLEVHQLPQSCSRWCGLADPAPQRLQDRQSHRLGARIRRGSPRHTRRSRLRGPLRRGGRPSLRAPGLRRHARPCYEGIRAIQREAREGDPGVSGRPRWPAIVLRTPKGWTGPEEVGGLPIEGTFRSHQVPLSNVRSDPEQLAMLEEWMRSYRPEELFDAEGKLISELAALAPEGERRMGVEPPRQRR